MVRFGKGLALDLAMYFDSEILNAVILDICKMSLHFT